MRSSSGAGGLEIVQICVFWGHPDPETNLVHEILLMETRGSGQWQGAGSSGEVRQFVRS